MKAIAAATVCWLFFFLTAEGQTKQEDITSRVKCCGQNELLSPPPYTCMEDIYKTSHFNLTTTFPTNCKETACIDEVYNPLDNVKHKKSIVSIKCSSDTNAKEVKLDESTRKCCPFGKVYYQPERKCIFATTNYTFKTLGKSYVKFGLPDCSTPIIDEIVNSEENAIYSAQKDKLKVGKFCIDQNENDKFVVRKCLERKYCFKNICALKCCPDGQNLVGGGKCFPTYNHGFENRFNLTSDFALIYAQSCFKYMPPDDVDYYIDKEGVLHVTEQGALVTYNPLEMGYCVEYLEARKGLNDGYYVFLCAISRHSITKLVAMCLSGVCLLLTIMGYGCLPDLRNLFGKTLVCYCSSLLVANTCLFIGMVADFSRTDCRPLGYVLVFTFIASFAWLTVICFDIWYQFSAIRIRSKSAKKDLRRFIIYNIFVWSLSIVITVIVMFLNFYELLPIEYSPIISYKSCFLDRVGSLQGDIIFFRTPIAIMMVINGYFFATTIYYCIKVKNEINKMKDHAKKKSFIVDKERMMLCLKLFIIMGVLWIMEVLTAFVHFRTNKYLAITEQIFDIINALQGVYIFIIYMCKRNVYQNIMKRFGLISRTSSMHTNTTELSSTKQDSTKERVNMLDK